MDRNHYIIMSADKEVAEWKDGTLHVLNGSLLPLLLRRVPDAGCWLEQRAVDSHRANSRLLKKALRLSERDDISTVIHVHAATITDNYWIRQPDSPLTYDDIRFRDDFFSALALKGSYEDFDRAATSGRSKTPELTNIGSFEKCWKLIDGKWWMYKKADHEQMFSELFVCRLGQALGMDMVEYERGDGYIKTPDFTRGASVNYESAFSFMGDNEDYEAVIAKLTELCPQTVPDYIRLIFLDTVVANPDRHTQNFGVLRHTETGEILSLAPNFDNNMALIARGYPSAPRSSDLLIRLFNEVIEKHPEYKAYLPSIDEDTVRRCIDDLHMKVRKEAVVELVMKRFGGIKR